MNDNLVPIGHTLKPHGIGGEIKLALEPPFLDAIEDIKVLFIQQKGAPVPYFLENVRIGNAVIVKLEDVNTREQAELIANSSISVRETDLPADMDDYGFAFLEGFKLHDEFVGEIGKIIEIAELPHQVMAVVNYQNREVLIPLNDTYIQKIDKRKKLITMSLPEGLLDI